jgi:hypothetical protein
MPQSRTGLDPADDDRVEAIFLALSLYRASLRLRARHHELVEACGRDVELLRRFGNRALLVRRLHGAEVLAALADVVDAPAGHSSIAPIRSLLGAQGKLIVPKRDF